MLDEHKSMCDGVAKNIKANSPMMAEDERSKKHVSSPKPETLRPFPFTVIPPF